MAIRDKPSFHRPSSLEHALPLLTHVVTFWHGPLDKLRQTCLRSQLAQAHKVTVFSFGPIPNLPDGVANADAETILPRGCAHRRLTAAGATGRFCNSPIFSGCG
jgi:hypothetical protein